MPSSSRTSGLACGTRRPSLPSLSDVNELMSWRAMACEWWLVGCVSPTKAPRERWRKQRDFVDTKKVGTGVPFVFTAGWAPWRSAVRPRCLGGNYGRKEGGSETRLGWRGLYGLFVYKCCSWESKKRVGALGAYILLSTSPLLGRERRLRM